MVKKKNKQKQSQERAQAQAQAKPISPIEMYKHHIDEIIKFFEEKKIPEVEQLCTMYTQVEHKIIGDKIILPLFDAMSAILSIASGDKLLNNDMLAELVYYIGNKVRNLLKKHFPKYWRGLLEEYLKHCEKVRNHYLAKVYAQALKGRK